MSVMKILFEGVLGFLESEGVDLKRPSFLVSRIFIPVNGYP